MNKKILFCLIIFLLSCQKNNLSEGKKSPEIAVFNLKEERVKLEDLFIKKQSPLLLTFWSESCGICVREIKELEENFGGKINVFAINIDGEKLDCQKTAEKFSLNKEKILKDQLNITAQRYELKGTPSSFLISADKKLHKKFIGKVDFKELNSHLNQLNF